MPQTVASTCWECSAKCGSLITVEDDGRVSKIAPNPASPVSKGAFCVKGIRALPEWTYHPDRLTYPMRRVGERGSGQWQRISWDEALDEMADRMATVRETYGAPALVGAVSGAAFSRGPIMALLMRSLGSPNWMINQDLCGGCRAVSDKITGLSIAGGEDIENANCILIVGRNPMAADPVQWMAIKRAKARGAKIVVIDPYRTSAAEIADLWLRPQPGSDTAIAMSMMQQIIGAGQHDASAAKGAGGDDLPEGPGAQRRHGGVRSDDRRRFGHGTRRRRRADRALVAVGVHGERPDRSVDPLPGAHLAP